MKATATTVLKLVQGSKVFLIPTFQRRYTWRREQWSQLWSDLLNEYDINYPEDPDSLYGHFLGSVVLHPAPGPASTLMRHQVIDGQQRLTTILVLLAGIRDVRKAIDPGWNVSEIDDQYLTNPFSKEFPDRLVPTKLDREAYQTTVRGLVPTGDIGIAYNFFRSKIERAIEDDGLDLRRLEDSLLLHLLIVEITTKSGDSVNSIFNTLNSKGMELSAADLVRNEILHHIGEKLGDDAYEKYWIPMELDLMNNHSKSPDREFVTFLWSREVAIDSKTSRDDLFPKFERRLRSELAGRTAQDRESLAMRVLEEMSSDRKLFLVVRDPSREIDNVSISPSLIQALQALKDWRSDPVTPISLWVLKQAVEGHIDQEDAAEALRVLLSYLVKRILNGIPTNQLNRLLTPIAFELAHRSPSESVANKMQSILSKPGYYWPSDDQILATVASNPVYASARRYVKFLLATVERRLPGNESADLSKSQIEHIMPQTLSGSWRSDFEAAGVELGDAEALTHTLGNLTLTDSNQKMGNASFAEKRSAFFSESALRLNRALARQNSFLPLDIQSRSRELAKLILSEFHHTPLSSSTEFSEDGSGASVGERLESLLQSFPIDTWVTEDDLLAFLGVTTMNMRSVANSLDPTLARLIRNDDGSVPRWLSVELRSKVHEQDTALPELKHRLTGVELAELTSPSSETDQYSEAGEEPEE